MTNQYPWLQPALTTWQQLMRSSRQPHAVLLTGAAGLGKKYWVKKALMELWCAEKGCGNCKHCQWILNETHPDCRYLQREEGAKTIKIDDVREACSWLQLSPLQSHKKVLVVNPAEALNIAASNALLKTLEEPPASALIILISEKPQQLLATVRSRCFKIHIVMPSETTIKKWLADHAPELANMPIMAGLGPLAIVEKWQGASQEIFENTTQIFTMVLQGNMFFVEAAEKLKAYPFKEMLMALDYFYGSQLRKYINQDNLVALKNWLLFEEKLAEVKRFQSRNANLNEQLQCEQLMLSLGKVFSGPLTGMRGSDKSNDSRF